MSYISEAKANEFFESNCMYIDGHGDLVLRRDAGNLLCMDAIKTEEAHENDRTYKVFDGTVLLDGLEGYNREEFMRAVTTHNYYQILDRLAGEDLSDQELAAVEFIKEWL